MAQEKAKKFKELLNRASSWYPTLNSGKYEGSRPGLYLKEY